MVQREELSVREALRWCGVEGMSSREALRMMRLPNRDQVEDMEPEGCCAAGAHEGRKTLRISQVCHS